MLDRQSLDLIYSLVDFGLIATIAGLIFLAASRRVLREKLKGHGGLLIVSGLSLALLAHIWEIGYHIAQRADLEIVQTLGFTYFSVERVHLLLSIAGFSMIAIGVLMAVLTRKNAETEVLDARRELEVSKYFEYQAEERFRYLFNSTSNAVYCYRFDPPMPTDLSVDEQVERSYDAVLQDCNVIFARELGADDPAEVIGGRLGDLDSAKDRLSHQTYFRNFVEGDYRLESYDLDYAAPDGGRRSLRVNMVGVVRGGLLHRMWAVESNLTALRETEKALAQRRKFQALMASVSSRLVTALDEQADEVVEGCMKAVCEFADADRSTLFWLDAESDSISIAHFWNPDGTPCNTVSLDQFPEFGARLKAFEVVRINDAEVLSEEYKTDTANLRGFDIKSLLVLPLVVGGKTVGGMTCGRLKKQKDWSDQEIEDLKVFAELFASYVLSLKSRRELADAMTQLTHAKERLEAENVYLRKEIELNHGFDEIVGRSDRIMRCLQLVEQVAPTKTPVLIMGETGTGKELIARAIHELSDRRDRPLVKVNCAALPANLIESELFGHEKGAFTGADSAKRGRFDLAHGSTLFLDEIGEIPIELQAKLLRVLQEGEFERLGGGKTIKVDVRLVVATNRDLTEAVQVGEFRSDLYYRINTFPIVLPALRERGDDIDLLAHHFVTVHAPRLGRAVSEISSDMMNQLRRYDWPGNVRELEGIVQRALISSTGPVLTLAAPLVSEADRDAKSRQSVPISDLKLIEREHIVAVLEDVDWKISGSSGAAAKLGIPPSTLRSKMKKLSIMRPQ